MNRDDVIRWAREAGLDTLNGIRDDDTLSPYYEAWPEQLERFAAIVAAAEREACAKVCDAQHDRARTSTGALRALACAAAIRARGQA